MPSDGLLFASQVLRPYFYAIKRRDFNKLSELAKAKVTYPEINEFQNIITPYLKDEEIKKHLRFYFMLILSAELNLQLTYNSYAASFSSTKPAPKLNNSNFNIFDLFYVGLTQYRIPYNKPINTRSNNHLLCLSKTEIKLILGNDLFNRLQNICNSRSCKTINKDDLDSKITNKDKNLLDYVCVQIYETAVHNMLLPQEEHHEDHSPCIADRLNSQTTIRRQMLDQLPKYLSDTKKFVHVLKPILTTANILIKTKIMSLQKTISTAPTTRKDLKLMYLMKILGCDKLTNADLENDSQTFLYLSTPARLLSNLKLIEKSTNNKIEDFKESSLPKMYRQLLFHKQQFQQAQEIYKRTVDFIDLVNQTATEYKKAKPETVWQSTKRMACDTARLAAWRLSDHKVDVALSTRKTLREIERSSRNRLGFFNPRRRAVSENLTRSRRNQTQNKTNSLQQRRLSTPVGGSNLNSRNNSDLSNAAATNSTLPLSNSIH